MANALLKTNFLCPLKYNFLPMADSPPPSVVPDSFEDEASPPPSTEFVVPDSFEDEDSPPPSTEFVVPDSFEDEDSPPPTAFVVPDGSEDELATTEFAVADGSEDEDEPSSSSSLMEFLDEPPPVVMGFVDQRNNKEDERKRKGKGKAEAKAKTKEASLGHQHLVRLRYVLNKLMSRRNWGDAAGVVSLLLQGSLKTRSLHHNRIKYSAAIELLGHVDTGRPHSKDLDGIYNLWMKKIAPKQNRSWKDKSVLHESIVSFLLDKYYDEAWSSAMCLKMVHEVDDDPISNLVLGLCHFELWYKTLPGNRKLIDIHQDDEIHHEMGGSEGVDQCFSVFSPLGFPDALLFPIQWDPLKENIEDVLKELKPNYDYKDAVVYLRKALNSSPRVEEALLPLVQILLLNDHVKEAFDEIERSYFASKTLFASKLKTHYFECLGWNNHEQFYSSYEDILKKDPTCKHALTKLILAFQMGEYDLERLLDMIALHLDAAFADDAIWREFASCLLKVFQKKDAEGSCNQNKEIPAIFVKGVNKKSWKLRCKWWMDRHFNKKLIASEIAGGELSLIAYKAASAAQMYGPGFYYVVEAGAFLKENQEEEEEKDSSLFAVLSMYVQSSTSPGFFPGTVPKGLLRSWEEVFNCDRKMEGQPDSAGKKRGRPPAGKRGRPRKQENSESEQE